jgi:hypothetical protein
MNTTTKPARHRVPNFTRVPEHGSHGVGPCQQLENGVSATSTLQEGGGYRDFNQPNLRELNATEQANLVRLVVSIWGYGSCEAALALLGEAQLKSNKALNDAISNRLKPYPSNDKYLMIREVVQVHNLGVNIRNLARITVALRVPATAEPDEDQAVFDRNRRRLAKEYEAATWELINRATDQANKAIIQNNKDHSGTRTRVLEARLDAIIATFNTDPFVDLDPAREKLYIDLKNDERRLFWLAHYDDEVVAWNWLYIGLIDLSSTFRTGPMKKYSREEFAYTCDAMWRIVIAVDLERSHLVQSGSVADRGTNAFVVTDADRARFRAAVASFNEKYNFDNPNARVDSLRHLLVMKHTIKRAAGNSAVATALYIAQVEARFA